MRVRRYILLFAAMVLLVGCSGERNAPPVANISDNGLSGAASGSKPGEFAGGDGSLKIEPPYAYRGTVLRLQAASFPAGAKVEWVVNGKSPREGGYTFDTAGLKKGDTVLARLTEPDGKVFSRAVTLRNSPPEIRSVRFVPGENGRANWIGVEVETFDADEDKVKVEIEWLKNGSAAGTGNRIGTPVKRGDMIEVTVTAHDPEERGKPAMLKREIRNTPPVIEGQEQFQVDGGVVTFRVKAVDHDGDKLSYSVKEAPPGLNIDRGTGLVRWVTAPGTAGKVPFTVTVSDGSGGETTARFNVTITEQPPVRSK